MLSICKQSFAINFLFIKFVLWQRLSALQAVNDNVAGYTHVEPFIAYERTVESAPNHRKQRFRTLSAMSPAHELHRRIRRPPSSNGGPLSVMLGFYLESLGDFRETQMSFEVDLYMYISWKDPSLKHSGPDAVMINDDALRREIWLPDLYFANARQATFHDVTVPNFNLFIATDGTVAYSSRVTLTVACNLKLHDYPMDEQQCHIRVLSYAYIAKMVNVTWFRHQPIMYNPEIDLPEFNIDQIVAEYCDGTYRYAVTERSYKTDRFSCLMGNLYLKRRIGFNIVQSYIPTGLIVIISWVSFWIDRRAVPARVTLSFTTLLTMTTLGNGMRFVLPRVSYAKAIDYWFGGCMLFVFMALVEFALVNSYMRRSDKYEKLSNRIRRRASVDIFALSPILSSELAHDHEQMLKMRRKSSALALNKNFKGQSVPSGRKLRIERDNSTVSEELSESRDDSSRMISSIQSNKNGRKARQQAVPVAQPPLLPPHPSSNINRLKKSQSDGAAGDCTQWSPSTVAMNGSYYDNMNWSVIGRKGSEDKVMTEKKKSGGISVAFTMDELTKNNIKLNDNLNKG
ncbi:Neurotransmitter-gated ion-channel transmembrane region [Globodera pallida]|nr:Neurotransmitter-gated ion-channel transmembrane region [Globodera pallida]